MLDEQTDIIISEETYTNITCHNANDGTITVVASSSVGTLTYTLTRRLDDGSVEIGASQNNGIFTELGAGTYRVSVSDGADCPAFSNYYTIINPDQIIVGEPTINHVTCHARQW